MPVKGLKEKLNNFGDDERVHFRCDCPYEEEEMDEVFPNWRSERMIEIETVLFD